MIRANPQSEINNLKFLSGNGVFSAYSLCLDDFAATQTGGAHAQTLSGALHLGTNRTQVDVPAPLAHVVGVADGVTELRPFAADITNLCHECSRESQNVRDEIWILLDRSGFGQLADRKQLLKSYLRGLGPSVLSGDVDVSSPGVFEVAGDNSGGFGSPETLHHP